MRFFSFFMQPEGIIILVLVALILLLVFFVRRTGGVKLMKGGTEVKVKGRKKAK